jgi:hypothetical protein
VSNINFDNDEEYRLPGIPTIRWMGMTNTGVPYMNFMLSKYFTYQNVNVNKHKKIIQQKYLGGILHLKPTTGCQISTLIFRFRGEPYKYPKKNCRKTAKFFLTWGYPTHALKSVKGPGNTFELKPKWERTLPSFDNFYGIFIALPKIEITKSIFWDSAPQAHSRVSNINFDIWAMGGAMNIP